MREGASVGATTSTAGEVAERWLAEAYELVESGWCQGANAVNEHGTPVEPESVFARRWSPSGALVRIWRRSDVDDALGLNALQLANLALTAAVNDIPASWNDVPARRRDEVLEAVLHAVSLVRDPALFGTRFVEGDGVPGPTLAGASAPRDELEGAA